jgi:predicted ABC-type ATPase
VHSSQSIRPLYAGHKAAAELRQRLDELMAGIPSMFSAVENTRVLALVKEIEESIDDHVLAIDGLIRDQYNAAPQGRAQKKSCGANADGGGGFQPGNTCAGEGGSGGGSTKESKDSKKDSSSTSGKSSKDYPKVRPDARHSIEQYTDAKGNWTPERKTLHTNIISESLKGKTPVDKPVAYLMGGGPASGKSSALRDGGVDVPENTVHIDSDEIKAKLPEYQEMTAAGDTRAAAFIHEESSAVSKDLQKQAASGGYNTLLDGTGDGSIESLERKVEVMRSAGQKVVAHYVTVDTETAVQRAMARAQKTGRLVPEQFIRNNHADVSRVAPEAVARGLFDEFTLWDTNSGTKKVASAQGSKLTIHDQKAWDAFVAKGK